MEHVVIARWTFAALVIIFAAALYWLARRVQLLLTHAEQLLNVGAALLAAVPSKSAPRTDGDDAQPHRWWQKLRALAAMEVPVTERKNLDSFDVPTPSSAGADWPSALLGVPAADAITPQAIADDDWLAEQREWLDQQVADAREALFAAYPAPTARSET